MRFFSFILLLSFSPLVKAKVVLIKTNQLLRSDDKCVYELLNPNSGSDIYKVTCPNKLPLQLSSSYQEKNLTWKIFNLNDPNSEDQWALGLANVENYWARMKPFANNPLVGIIDTGIDFKHEDLINSIAYNTNEIPDNSIDDDNNGYVDDYIGWNALDKTKIPLDDHYHGTAIAGIINAKINNQIGIAGLLTQNSIVPIKFLSPAGGNTDVAIVAIDYAISRKVKIINVSWGGPKPSPLLEEMIKRCQKLGILFIAAAGNESVDNEQIPTYPANYAIDNIISVASMNWRGELSDHSNFGKRLVHIAAPGESIMTTIPNNRYGFMTGTSYAAPHIAAAASMIWSQNPTYNYLEVKNYLLAHCRVDPSMNRKLSCNGRLDFDLL